MPVRKYRSVAEMPDQALVHDKGDPAIPKKIRYIWAFSEALLSPVGTCIPRGVRKYRTADEAYADRDNWETERIARLRAAREQK